METTPFQQNLCLFGEGSTLRGELHLKGMTRISSNIDGTIHIDEEDSCIIIEWMGSVKGDIFCYNIEIFGTFSGNIMAQGKIILHPSCNVHGSLTAKNLIVYPGADINIEGNTKNSEH